MKAPNERTPTPSRSESSRQAKRVRLKPWLLEGTAFSAVARRKFFSLIRVENGCWNWVGTIDDKGYARFSIAGGYWYAHRWMAHFALGPLPPDRVVDHRCRNPKCVNPDHLEIITQKQNVDFGLAPLVNGRCVDATTKRFVGKLYVKLSGNPELTITPLITNNLH